LWTREELAAYLSRARGAEVDPECVVVTAGSTHALTLIARTLLLQEQKVIAFENPTHRVLQRAVFRTGLEPVGVPVDENGLRVDELELSGARCVLVSPAHQFPLGVALAVERRTQLLEWAERSDGVVIEDDYDAEFRYDRAPVGSLQGLAPERVVYIGSTSKTLAPALRLGWAVLPAALVEPFSAELLASTLHMPALEQLAFADFVSRGELDRHMYRARAAYRRRRDIAITVLADQLPELPIRGIGAGLHLVAELSTQTEEDAAWEKATAAGIALETLSSHALPGYSGPRGLLIGFAATSEPTIPLAIRALAKALNQEG
jgi:GntR family transcriptional regulator/MocR family aminotransferase